MVAQEQTVAGAGRPAEPSSGPGGPSRPFSVTRCAGLQRTRSTGATLLTVPRPIKRRRQPDTLLGCGRDDAREDVRLHNGDQADERGARYREPEHTAEDWPERSRAFPGVLVACRR